MTLKGRDGIAGVDWAREGSEKRVRTILKQLSKNMFAISHLQKMTTPRKRYTFINQFFLSTLIRIATTSSH